MTSFPPWYYDKELHKLLQAIRLEKGPSMSRRDDYRSWCKHHPGPPWLNRTSSMGALGDKKLWSWKQLVKFVFKTEFFLFFGPPLCCFSLCDVVKVPFERVVLRVIPFWTLFHGLRWKLPSKPFISQVRVWSYEEITGPRCSKENRTISSQNREPDSKNQPGHDDLPRWFLILQGTEDATRYRIPWNPHNMLYMQDVCQL